MHELLLLVCWLSGILRLIWHRVRWWLRTSQNENLLIYCDIPRCNARFRCDGFTNTSKERGWCKIAEEIRWNDKPKARTSSSTCAASECTQTERQFESGIVDVEQLVDVSWPSNYCRYYEKTFKKKCLICLLLRYYLLKPQTEDVRGRKTLILDVDETLVHSSFTPTDKADIVLPIDIEGRICNIYVQVRP